MINGQLYRLYTKLTREGKIPWFGLFSTDVSIDQGCTDWCKIGRPEIVPNCLLQFSMSNMKLSHVFEVEPL